MTGYMKTIRIAFNNQPAHDGNKRLLGVVP